MNPIRNSAKAIIIKDKKVLFIKGKDKDGLFYILPGGGQEPGETFHNTLIRECKEELGEAASISIEDVLLIREYIGKNHEFAEYDKEVHQIEFMFECTINDDYTPQIGDLPDKMQLGTEWIEIDELVKHRIYPSFLKETIKDLSKNRRTQIYWGDVN